MGKKSKSKTARSMSASSPSKTSATPSAPAAADARNGTIHVQVVRASNLPTMDFGKRQDPFVLVQLEGADPKVWGATDPAFQGGVNPEWPEGSNNELELFFDAAALDQALLTVEVFADEAGDELIGTGQLNVTEIAQTQQAAPTEFTLRLKDGARGSNRGEVLLRVWFGPPVRRAFRAAQRATKLLDARDAFVAMLYSLVSAASAYLSAHLQVPTEFAKKHRKLSIALAAVLGVTAAGALATFLAIAVPTAIVAAFTFPFWILPFLATAFFTSPLWIPILLLVAAFLFFLGSFVFGLGVTSRPVRRKGAMLSAKIKHSEVGKRVVYEKTE